MREGGREAVTHWQVLERYAGADGKPVASLLACTLETGRTHQIRVHLAHIGHPIMGDETYATGFKTKAACSGPRPKPPWRALQDRRCMPICWPSNTPIPEKTWRSKRNCRAICVVYVMPWSQKPPRAERAASGKDQQI